MIDALVGRRQEAALALDDFAHVRDADLLVRLLRGAVAERAAGVNILIHGPPRRRSPRSEGSPPATSRWWPGSSATLRLVTAKISSRG